MEVVLNGGESFTTAEMLAGELRESDCYVRVKKSDEFVEISFDMGLKLVGEISINNCPNEHGGRH